MIESSTITILFTSDIHGQIMPLRYGTNEQADIGLAKYATIVKEMQKNREAMLVIDNGDLIQGTPFMSHYVKAHAEKNNPIIEVMNDIETTAVIVGNHEFNFGQEVLKKAVNESKFPWLAANILDEVTKEPFFGKPYLMKEWDGGLKVAVVGVTTHFIPNWEKSEHIEGIYFADAYTTLKKWVEKIRHVEHPDIVIVAYHGGFERDLETGEPLEPLTGENQAYRMCMEIGGIDVLLTGHQHREINAKINNVAVVQPGCHGKLFSEITIKTEKDKGVWKIVDKYAQLRALNEVKPDEDVMTSVQELETSTQRWLDEPLGYISGDMTIRNAHQARVKKHPFIQFIQNIQMDASGVDISVSSLLNNDTTGFGSVVTMRDVVYNYMYPNTLVVLELTGKDIKEALEKSATYFALDEDGEIIVHASYLYPKVQHYNYDMWEGIDYQINVAKERGNRVEHLHYKGKPLEMEASYKVVLNNYRASGGGNYDMFRNKPIVKEILKDTAQLIYDYFQANHTVKASVTENFRVVAHK